MQFFLHMFMIMHCYFFDHVVQVLVPVKVWRPLMASAGTSYALSIFPYFFTLRTPSASSKCIPTVTAGALPVGFPIWLPVAFRAANFYIVHDIKKFEIEN